MRFDPPQEFVVPGENRVAAALDFARTVVRRAERDAVGATRAGWLDASSQVVPYLNRLADLVYTLARWQEGAWDAGVHAPSQVSSGGAAEQPTAATTSPKTTVERVRIAGVHSKQRAPAAPFLVTRLGRRLVSGLATFGPGDVADRPHRTTPSCVTPA